jgi:hypothetical protein
MDFTPDTSANPFNGGASVPQTNNKTEYFLLMKALLPWLVPVVPIPHLYMSPQRMYDISSADVIYMYLLICQIVLQKLQVSKMLLMDFLVTNIACPH